MRRNGWHLLAALAVLGLFAAPAAAQDIYGSTALTSAPNMAKRVSQLEAELAELRAAVDGGGAGMMQCDRQYSGVVADVEYLRLWARRSGLNAGIDMTGADRNLNYDYDDDNAFRVSLGYRFESGWDVVFAYTYFNTTGASGDIAALVPVVGASVVNGQAALDYNVLDLEFGRWRCINPNTDLRMFAGVRYGIIDQVAVSTITPGAGVINTRMTNFVDAIGLRAGGQFNWRVRDNISVFGKAGAGIMVADASNSYSIVSTAGGVASAAYTDSPIQAAPTLEASIGGAWRSDGFELAIGYELTQWFNVSAMPPAVAALPMTTAINGSEDLLVDGLFIRAGWNF